MNYKTLADEGTSAKEITSALDFLVAVIGFIAGVILSPVEGFFWSTIAGIGFSVFSTYLSAFITACFIISTKEKKNDTDPV